MKPVRLAVIGIGHLGRIHARLAKETAGCELVAVVDTSQAARSEAAAQCSAMPLASVVEAIGRIDAAIVATPTSSHFEVAARLMAAGVHVMVEKPLAITSKQADDLVQVAARQNVVLQVGHVERFNPALAAAMPLLDDVKYIAAERLSPYPARSTDVGVVLDLMIHDLDVVLSIAQSPVRHVDAIGAAVVGPNEDLATARLVFENGCVANLTASRVSYIRRRTLQAFTSDNHVSIDFARKRCRAIQLPSANGMAFPSASAKQKSSTEDTNDIQKELLESLEDPQSLEVGEHNQIQAEQVDFIRSVQTSAAPRVDGTAGRDALVIAERILDSLSHHQWDGTANGRIGPQMRHTHPIILPGPTPTPASHREAG